MRQSLHVRFWAKVNKQGALHCVLKTRCWEWTAATDGRGYGTFKVMNPRRQICAHRMSWELENGPIPRGDGYHGACVLHRCDNPVCVRPAHLFLGTVGDNVRDMFAKGRSKTLLIPGHSLSPKGDDHWARRCPGRVRRGSGHGLSKVTEDDVRKIRRLYAAGEKTQVELGRVFGISHVAVGMIVRRKTWTHVT